jgi:hypothetical protein
MTRSDGQTVNMLRCKKGHAVSAGYTPTAHFLERGSSSVSVKAGNLLTGLAIIKFHV